MNENLCKKCKYAKDNWYESCYCTYYGYIVYRGKTDCWGYETSGKKEEEKQDEVSDSRPIA